LGVKALRGVNDGPQCGETDLARLSVTACSSLHNEGLPELAALVFTVDDGEHDVEHLAAAVLAARQHAVLAGITGLDVHRERNGGAVRYRRELPLHGSIGVVESHALTS